MKRALLFWSVVFVVAGAACSTAALGIDTCRQIEESRCRAAEACPGIQLSIPRPAGNAVDSCVRYYHDACLHGLTTSVEPLPEQVEACVSAINSGDCAIVQHPELSPKCAWLTPSPQQDASAPALPDAAAPPP